MLVEILHPTEIKLTPEHPLFGKKVAVVGGGPAGAFLAYNLASQGVDVDIFEPRTPRTIQLENSEEPKLCPGCAGLLQLGTINMLTLRGLKLPLNVIQAKPRTTQIILPGTDSVISLNIPQTTVYRGTSPLEQKEGHPPIESFDAWLLDSAIKARAHHYQVEISSIDLREDDQGKVLIVDKGGNKYHPDLVIGAFGHNRRLMQAIQYPETDPIPLKMPESQRAGVREYFIPDELLTDELRNGAFVFPNPAANVLFGAIYPKGKFENPPGMYFTLALMGRSDITADDFKKFLTNPQVHELFKIDPDVNPNCSCKTLLTLKSPRRFIVYDTQGKKMRMVNIGDSGPTRPRKNGIGAALDSAEKLAYFLLKYGNTPKAMKKYQRYIERTYVWDNYVVDSVMRFSDFVLNHELPRRAVIYLNDPKRRIISKAAQSTIEHILTGKSPYWRIPLDVIKETFARPTENSLMI